MKCGAYINLNQPSTPTERRPGLKGRADSNLLKVPFRGLGVEKKKDHA